MKIKSVEFAGAIAQPGGKPPAGDLRQVAFAGRSNVGKSSLINTLLGRTRSRVARVSSTPGKTREINFYRVRVGLSDGAETDFFLVDLPGYGYARVPLAVRERWKPLIEGYLRQSEALVGVVQLIDARHGPTRDDLRMVEYLAATGVPTLFVLTKIDKLSRSQRAVQIRRITETLGVESDQVLAFSSHTGEGREALLESLEQLLRETGGRA